MLDCKEKWSTAGIYFNICFWQSEDGNSTKISIRSLCLLYILALKPPKTFNLLQN